jgi:hypothetical protein
LILSEGGVNRRIEFQKGSQLFLRTHNETLSIAAMCVSHPELFGRLGPAALLIARDRLRCGFARFKLQVRRFIFFCRSPD